MLGKSLHHCSYMSSSSSGSATIPSFYQVLSTSGETPTLEKLYPSSRKRFPKVMKLEGAPFLISRYLP
uniref:Uncharacterized protein n=1 Tax=Triticum urartu TaxID=4572 RepID=A0A8R7PIY8_TRIUA